MARRSRRTALRRVDDGALADDLIERWRASADRALWPDVEEGVEVGVVGTAAQSAGRRRVGTSEAGGT